MKTKLPVSAVDLTMLITSCKACGHICNEVNGTLERRVYYKSGVKKGKFKGLITHRLKNVANGATFRNLSIEKGFSIQVESGYEMVGVSLIHCPECGTVMVTSCAQQYVEITKLDDVPAWILTHYNK